MNDAQVHTDDELVLIDLPDLLRRGLPDAQAGAHWRGLFGAGAVGAAVMLDRVDVSPRSVTFLAEIARAGGASYAAGLAAPLPDPRAAALATTWLQAAAEGSDDGTMVATWLEAIAALIELRRRSRELQS